MKKKIYAYRLTDGQGNQQVTLVNEVGDSGCIGGYDAEGKYHQYDSYELYHAYEWAAERGMKLEYAEIEIDIPDDLFK